MKLFEVSVPSPVKLSTYKFLL